MDTHGTEKATGQPRISMLGESAVDVAALEAALKARLQGEVRFDVGSRALYATDSSNYRQVPIGVVVPRTIEDVVTTVALCHQYGVPLLSRGGGTSLAGQCCNVAVVMDFSKYLHRLIELDPERRIARVQPGIVLDDLRGAAEQHHLTFGPDPSTHNRCTLGGMIGNNSCGVHSVMAGRTVDNVEELEILTYDGLRMRVGPTSEEELERIIQEGGRRGEIYARLKALRDKYADLIRSRYPKIPRRVSGYNLDELLPENGFNVARALVGTESTCVVVLEATTRLVYSPPARTLLVLGYPDVFSAGDHVVEVLGHGPVGLEGIDDGLVRDMTEKGLHPEDLNLLPDGRGWLLVEFGAETKDEADAKARALMDDLSKKDAPPSMRLYDSKAEELMIWQIRESGLGATAFVPGKRLTWEGWEDSAVPPDKVGDYLRELRKLLDKHGYGCDLYGHFGQGCIHTRIDFDLESAAGIANFRSFLEEATDLVVRFGGSISGEHGDGQSKAEFLVKMFGPELIEAFREFKAIWDPAGKMNPGKIVEPYRVDENLRLGTQYAPPSPKTYFQFPDDHGSMPRATLRCVGVGACRKENVGTMCPSYMVTREEMHSTRGRAHLLFEMFQGNPLSKGWKDETVKEALDLCIACKGCKGECPVNVDMATYKAEFLAHYFSGRLRPLTAYTMGLITYWSRLAALVPNLANLVTQTPGLRAVAKALAGIHADRAIPAFAPETFTSWFRGRQPRNVGQAQVILWPDTFNNHFHPEVAKAAVEVLETAGLHVLVPEQRLCCGRPLYDFGFLDQAKHLLTEILESLRPQIRDGIPVIGLEPSCVSVFRDELTNLFPNDEDAIRLKDQTYLLSEYLDKKLPDFELPKLEAKVLLHGHCHHKSLMKMDSEIKVLRELGVDYELVDSGCCGMAGAFGFEKPHYEISLAMGERKLLPVVRKAGEDTVILTNGFSCREQITQTTPRKTMHLSQLLLAALRGETPRPDASKPPIQLTTVEKALLAGAGMLLAAGAMKALRRRS